MKHFWVLFLIFGNALAQQKGIVVDEQNNPIPYVNIWVENKEKGTTTDEKGFFELNCSQTENLIISAIGFEKIVAPFSERITLKKAIYTLEEVVVSNPKNTKEVEIGNSKMANNYQLSGLFPIIFAKYFPYKEQYSDTPYLKKVVVMTRSRSKEATFRLRILSVGQDGLPFLDIPYKDIIVKVKKGKKVNIIDVSEHKIKIPENGLFIGYEFLLIEENKYFFEFKTENNNKQGYYSYSPDLVINNTDEENSFMFTNKWVKRHKYFNQHLEKEVETEPAINLILTN